ncbi:MAG: YaaA family protein [Actinomycetota bacterium]
MKILLPPSETKRVGGTGLPLDLRSLAFPGLLDQRELVVEALVRLSGDVDQAQRVLKLSARQIEDIGHNGALRSAPTMPAVDRYTGVLFDALDAASLPGPTRRWLGAHVLIHSAPFGPVSALDPIPTYRLSAGTSLPGVPPLRRLWSTAVTEAFAESGPDLVLDLRSEAYVALGPVPEQVRSAYVRVVADEGGHTRALNHFNKKSKGLLVRALAEDRPRISSLRALHAWADGRGLSLRPTRDDRVLDLVVPS